MRRLPAVPLVVTYGPDFSYLQRQILAVKS